MVETMIKVMIITADGNTERRSGNDESGNYRAQNSQTSGAPDRSTTLSDIQSFLLVVKFWMGLGARTSPNAKNPRGSERVGAILELWMAMSSAFG